MTRIPSVQDFMRDWRNAMSAVRTAEKRLAEAREHARRAEVALAQRIAPKDMRDGEQIGIWVRVSDQEEALIVVRKHSVSGLSLEERR